MEIPIDCISGIANFVNFDKDNKMTISVTEQPPPFNVICDAVAKRLHETRPPLLPLTTTYYTVEIAGRSTNRMYKRKCDASNSLNTIISSTIIEVFRNLNINLTYGARTREAIKIKNELLKRGVLMIYKHFTHNGAGYKYPEIYK